MGFRLEVIGVLNRSSYGLYSVRKGFHRLLNGILMFLCYRVLLGSLGSGFAQSYYNVVRCSCRIFGGCSVLRSVAGLGFIGLLSLDPSYHFAKFDRFCPFGNLLKHKLFTWKCSSSSS